MSRPRIVLDTNVLISAALQQSSLPAKVVELVAYGAVELCVSSEILTEYREVFARAKFNGLDPSLVVRLLGLIADAATLVVPSTHLAESPDESDNRFYECADAADADYIVTGNAKHFTKTYKSTQTVTPRQLLDLLAPGIGSK
jgi:putative PIN family toxin of toxin-antitoxin system